MIASRKGHVPIEQPAGPPLVPPLDAAEIDAQRKAVYQSYESFLRNRLSELDQAKASLWNRDYSSVDAYLRSVAPMRARLKKLLGFWLAPSERSPVRVEERRQVYSDEAVDAFRFTLEVFSGLQTYGIELIPKKIRARAGLLVQHGYGATPEIACGFARTANGADYSYRSMGFRAARRGFHVVAIHHPTGFGTLDDVVLSAPPGFPHQTHAYGKNRLHRLAVMAGGTLFGLDMMASSRGIDLLVDRLGNLPIGMYGLSQGGQSALYLPAIDERISASVCSAYFSHRIRKLIGPSRAMSYLDSHEEDKFFTDVISTFSDSDIVSLIAPRAFAVEAGELDGSVDFELAAHEFPLASWHYELLKTAAKIEWIPHHEGHVSATQRAFEFLEQHLAIQV